MNAEKKQIYFARTYRHLQVSRSDVLLFLLFAVLPAVVLLLFYYDELSYWMVSIASYILRASGAPGGQIASSTFIPGLGPSYYLILPTAQPEYGRILANLVVVFLLIWFFCSGARKGTPVATYLSIIFLVHTMACVFFLLGRDVFPYTLADYADLYGKQQIGIWIAFLVLFGFIMGLFGRRGLVRKLLATLCLMLYSFLFGTVRYTLFLWILFHFSCLYMPVMFFVLGPFFDFLYFIAIYAIYTNSMIHTYEVKRKGDWTWA